MTETPFEMDDPLERCRDDAEAIDELANRLLDTSKAGARMYQFTPEEIAWVIVGLRHLAKEHRHHGTRHVTE